LPNFLILTMESSPESTTSPVEFTRRLIDPSYDPRVIVEHKVKDCHCPQCYLYLNKLPPMQTARERYESYRFEEREAKKVKRQALKEVKKGKQHSLDQFFSIAKSATPHIRKRSTTTPKARKFTSRQTAATNPTTTTRASVASTSDNEENEFNWEPQS